MLHGLFIFIDDEFDDPIYADPDPAEFEDDLWVALCEAVNDAIEEDGEADGIRHVGEYYVGWRVMLKLGLAFVAVVTDDVKPQSVTAYLGSLSRRYTDEVDDVRNPERDGVEDVVVDVIPPWEDDED